MKKIVRERCHEIKAITLMLVKRRLNFIGRMINTTNSKIPVSFIQAYNNSNVPSEGLTTQLYINY